MSGEKTNGQITRATMASGSPHGKRLNNLPRVHSVAGIKKRAAIREANYEPRASSCEPKLIKGFNKPGSRNPRKVGR